MSNYINAGWTVLADGRMQIDKDPAASLRYGFDVAGLLASGDTISPTAVTISGQAGVTATQPGATGTVVSCRVAGGTAGETGSATLRWTTAQGDTDERTLLFRVIER